MNFSDCNRRTFLRAAGVSLALPWMESLPGALKHGSPERPVRMACLFMPNGVHVPSWQPKERGSKWKVTPTLAPLEAQRRDVFVLTGLRNKNSFTGEGHYVKTTALLSGAPVKKTGGHDIRCGISVDQAAAQEFGDQTPLPSLELSIDPVRNVVDMGYSTVYGSHISWRSPTQPVPREINPQKAFDRLFRTSRLLRPENRLVLDAVLEDAKRLKSRTGKVDAAKLDEYFEAVHAVEKRIEKMAAADRKAVLDISAGKRPGDFDPKDYALRVKLMLELIVLAFRADATRYATFMFGNAVSGRNFSFLDGVEGGFHPLSHHEKKTDKQKQYALINRWHVEQFAWLMEALRNIDDGGKSLLDRSMLFFASGIGDGNSHNPRSLPVLLAGRGGGKLNPGRHLVFRKDRRLCSLHLSMLKTLGSKRKRFGDSDKILPELFAG